MMPQLLSLQPASCPEMYIQLFRGTLQVVLPQLGVSDVGDVVERPAHNGLVLTLAPGYGLLHPSGLGLGLPGTLSELRGLRDARRKLGTQPGR